MSREVVDAKCKPFAGKAIAYKTPRQADWSYGRLDAVGQLLSPNLGATPHYGYIVFLRDGHTSITESRLEEHPCLVIREATTGELRAMPWLTVPAKE